MFNFFKKSEPKILYSCVIDDAPKFFWQGVIFVTTLIENAKVNPKNIYIHMIKKNSAFEGFLDKKGVNKVFINSWGDKKYCNKLQQIETPELQKADFVFLCDADIAFLDDISSLINFSEIVGKTVDFDNPSIDQLKLIFDYFNLSYPVENSETLNGQQTFDGNFNGGLYGIPGEQIKKFGCRWKYWAERLMKSDYIAQVLGSKTMHTDQISFCMALHESKYPYRKLDILYNRPTHINVELLTRQLKSKPSVLHFHTRLSSTGLG